MSPTISSQSVSIIDLLAAHGIHTDTMDLLPHYSQEDHDVHTYDVLVLPISPTEGSLYLPYEHTAGLMEIRELHWTHTQKTSSVTHVFPLRDHDNYTVIAQQILALLTDKGQQFE